MPYSTDGLDTLFDKVLKSFVVKHSARDRAFQLSREVIRNCANAIRAVHRSEFDKGQNLLDEAERMLREISEVLAEHQDLFFGGFVYDAEKEFAEGKITLAIISGRPLPDPDVIKVTYAAYLNGLGEAVGELRRHLLDNLRQGQIAKCEEILAAMDDVYSLLVTVDFPEAMTGGLRRTTDATRGILEKTRGDLTVALRQDALEKKLAALEIQLEEKSS